MHVLVTRPEPEASTMAAELVRMGHRTTLAPLLTIRFEAARPITLDGVQALIATSRNGLRGLARTAALVQASALPLFTVGPGTAEEARALGFSRIVQGPASARELAPLIAAQAQPAGGTLVHLAGDVLAFDLKGTLEAAGFTIRQETLYRSVAAERLAPEAADALRAGALDAAILMSPRTATIFTALLFDANLAEYARPLTYYCLSQAVAEALLPLAPGRIVVAAAANGEEMLALLARTAPESK